MMKMLGNELTDQEIKDIIKESASDKAGITYPAFCRLMGVGLKNSREVDPEEELQEAASRERGRVPASPNYI